MLIDTHCHLTADGLSERLDAVLTAARQAGVTRMIHVAVNPADARAALALLARHDELYLVAGVHPHEAGRCTAAELAALREILTGVGLPPALKARIVGVGETGLDFHYDFAPRAQQEDVFRAHLALALELSLPVVIHARESEARVCDILDEYPALAGRVVFHCYSAGPALTERILAAGHWCSFTGVVTFKHAEIIQASARLLPGDRIMVETDAPYLSPVPMRKIRPNEPALLVHTARFLADLRNETEADFAAATTANAERFFRLPRAS
jgi:TatD DNase family protein